MPSRRPSAGSSGLLIREAEAISGGALAVFLALSLLSYAPDAPHANLGGPVGHAIADTALHALGFAAYLFPVYLGYVTVTLLRPGAEDLGGLRLAGAGLLVVTILVHGAAVASAGLVLSVWTKQTLRAGRPTAGWRRSARPPPTSSVPSGWPISVRSTVTTSRFSLAHSNS